MRNLLDVIVANDLVLWNFPCRVAVAALQQPLGKKSIEASKLDHVAKINFFSQAILGLLILAVVFDSSRVFAAAPKVPLPDVHEEEVAVLVVKGLPAVVEVVAHGGLLLSL